MTDIFHVAYSPAALDDLHSIFSYICPYFLWWHGY